MTIESRGHAPKTSGHRASWRRARCKHCHEVLVDVPSVGWVNPSIGGAYDMCDADPYGNHDVDDAAP